MSTMHRRILVGMASVFTIAVLAAMPEPAAACPSCKAANETDSLRPKAYMYSILFMLAMPTTVFAGFSLCFYRMSRNEAEMAEMLLPGQDPDAVSLSDPGRQQGTQARG